MDFELVIKNIRGQLKDYITKYNIKSLVIGQSGGIDSALCTVLASSVCQETGTKLISRSISIETNKEDERDRAHKMGTQFCDDFVEIDLSDLYLEIREGIEESTDNEDDFATKLRRGNIKARIRMMYLYNLAQNSKGLVLSTDNYTEYLLGFWTLHGDVGDLGMIQELWKTEVYEIAKYLVENELTTDEQKEALQLCIDAVPTDGLGITPGGDLDQLGLSSYQEVDEVLKSYVEKPYNDDLSNPVIKRHKASLYKRNNPYNFKRDTIVYS